MADVSDLMRLVLAGTDAHVYVKDSNFHFVYGNAAVARTLQTTPEQMIGKADVDFVDEPSACPFREADQRVLATGKPEVLLTEIFVNGERLAFEDRKFPVQLPDGSQGVGGIAFLRRDQ